MVFHQPYCVDIGESASLERKEAIETRHHISPLSIQLKGKIENLLRWLGLAWFGANTPLVKPTQVSKPLYTQIQLFQPF